MIIARGTFTPGQGHILRGGFTFTETAGGIVLSTDEQFMFDGSPDPGFALNTGVPVDASDPVLQQQMLDTLIFRLPGNTLPVCGPRSGAVPDTLDLDAHDTLVLWCFRFPFILGFGAINPT